MIILVMLHIEDLSKSQAMCTNAGVRFHTWRHGNGDIHARHPIEEERGSLQPFLLIVETSHLRGTRPGHVTDRAASRHPAQKKTLQSTNAPEGQQRLENNTHTMS
ncbi:hypothetical protein PG997_013346 [Apiospora hydei]|uniref:Uncharacterized protein n=1 Tax=Apiospora hydei TaxID=1337664 RepID=A0ABR1V5W2_9PEZI